MFVRKDARLAAARKVLKIATISKSDLYGGGASRVAQLLADRYAETHPGSVHFCNRPGHGFGGHRVPFGDSQAINKMVRLGHAAARKVGFAESLPIDTPSLLSSVLSVGADVVHVHDTTSASSPVTLRLLSKRLPAVWTIHDASPFTGGCIQPMDCTRFRIGCGRCPQLGQWPLDGMVDLTRLHNRLRRQLHGSGRVELVTPSHWMRDLAFSSGMLPRPPRVIANPIDIDVFAPPEDKEALRRKLGLPTDRLVLIGVAGELRDPKKGFADILQVAASLRDLDPHLILIGRPDASATPLLAGLSATMTGFVSDPRELSEWYGSADAFVYCSSIDNQPLTILESMASGIPTFGYAVGGSGELVAQHQNGAMVEHGEAHRLADLVREAYGKGALRPMGAAAREYVVRHHALQHVAGLHTDLYEELATAERRGETGSGHAE